MQRIIKGLSRSLFVRPLRAFSTEAKVRECDAVIVGGGAAGSTIAYWLQRKGKKVFLIERENATSYHSTGRSAALFSETYGGPVLRKLTTGAKEFFYNPPSGFSDVPIVIKRPVVMYGTLKQKDLLEQFWKENIELVPNLYRVDGDQIQQMCPYVKKEVAELGIVEPEAGDIDVNALVEGFLRPLRSIGGVVCNAELLAVKRENNKWTCQTSAGVFRAPVVVNAAGAWAELVGKMFNARPIGLQPKRRTAIVFSRPDDCSAEQLASWPFMFDCIDSLYFRPDAGRILSSPVDVTPSEPCDAQPDELDMAICVDRMEQQTKIKVTRIQNKWAGLRSFTKDETCVIGYDKHVPGFFWMAALGGCGIQTAPATGEVGASMLLREGLPESYRKLGLKEADLEPARIQ